MEEATVNIKNGKKKRQKILIQIGVIIILLFTAVTLAVGNMITMSSFSTSLSGNMTMFTYSLETLIENMEDHASLPWLIDYWAEHADTLFADNNKTAKSVNIRNILNKLSRDTAYDVTPEEAASLSPEEQEAFAAYCYLDDQELFEQYQNDENYTIIFTVPSKSSDEEIIIFNSEERGDLNVLGSTIDIATIKEIVENTTAAMEAEVWRWAFTTPDKMMLFATCVPFSEHVGYGNAKLYGVLAADLVYGDMLYTNNIRNQVILMMLIVLALILLCLYFIVPRPLAKVKECVSDYSNTKDTKELTEKLSSIRSRNEIGAFADEFSSLALEMERYTREMELLAGEKERVATELNVAQSIQMQMLPHVFPHREEFSLFAAMTPAKEVGGDFYDCYMIDDDHLALTIADVSGKGVPAALFMAVSKTMLKNRTIVGGAPSKILSDVNNWLCEGNDNCMFVTVWLGILTISTGELICANAGHESPCIRFGDEAFRIVKAKRGQALGVLEGSKYRDENYTLSPGSALLVYTDGVPEANTSDESMFGKDRLESVLYTVLKDEGPEAIMQKVRAAVDEFAGDTPQYDDLTMLCLVMR